MIGTSSDFDPDFDPELTLATLLAEVHERLRAGQSANPETVAAAYPEQLGQLRDFLPVLAWMGVLEQDWNTSNE